MSKRREREPNSSLSSQEPSPNRKNCNLDDVEDEQEIPTLTMIYKMLLKVQDNTDQIRRENAEFKNEFEEIKKATSYQSEVIQDMQKENTQLRNDLKEQVIRAENMQEQMVELKYRINIQDEGLDEMNQYQRKYNIEIHGIPEEKDEDLEDIVEEIAKGIGANVEVDDIDIVHRQRSRLTPSPKQEESLTLLSNYILSE